MIFLKNGYQQLFNMLLTLNHGRIDRILLIPLTFAHVERFTRLASLAFTCLCLGEFIHFDEKRHAHSRQSTHF